MVESKDILSMNKVLSEKGIPTGNGYSYAMYLLRQSGHVFTFEEHIKAMLLSLLSANRPWKQIEENIDNLDKVFHQYNPEYLIDENPKVLMDEVCKIGCGNRAIMRQMEGVSYNVRLMQSIVDVIGDLEKLVVNNEPYDVSAILSSGHYKLAGFAQTLALQYLRNVGIDTCKPDVHIRRILARLRLIPYEDCPVIDVVNTMSRLSRELGIPITLVNEIIWTYGATGFGEICAKVPKCYVCQITECPWRKEHIGD